MPELAAGRLRPAKALLLGRAGLAGVTRADGKVTIGAATPVSALEDGDEPLATAARHVGDIEIRAQATVGGNLCASASADAPRGDLQAPLLALGATVRSAGKGGEQTEPLEDFLANGDGRLVLDVSYDDGRAPDRLRLGLAARTPTTTRSSPSRRRSGTASCASRRPAPARAPCCSTRTTPLAGLELRDDALASAWYRQQLLPHLVARALADLEEAR